MLTPVSNLTTYINFITYIFCREFYLEWECGDEQRMTSSTLYKSGVILENMSMRAVQRKSGRSVQLKVTIINVSLKISYFISQKRICVRIPHAISG